jgi:3-hydroxyisobutyrate dehydrogenase
MPNERRIAFIGLGGMGGGMASKLAESGYDVAVYNRTREKSEEVAALGATIADSPREAAADADIVMLSLADQHVVDAMLFGDDGVFGSLRSGGYIVDASTVPPDYARELAEKAAAAGYHAVEARVLGNPEHARQGELRVMAAGEEADFEAVKDVLETIGKQVTYFGESGKAATMKLVLNMLMAVQMPALAEAIVYGERAGLPRKAILEMIAGTGYSSPTMTFRCPIIADRSFYKAAFKLGLMRKDAMLVLAEAAELGVPMPVTEAAYTMLTAAKQQGLGDLDVAAIVAFQERLAGMDDYPWPESRPGDGAGPPAGVAAGRRPGAEAGG